MSPLDAPSCADTLEDGLCEGIACGKGLPSLSILHCVLRPRPHRWRGDSVRPPQNEKRPRLNKSGAAQRFWEETPSGIYEEATGPSRKCTIAVPPRRCNMGAAQLPPKHAIAHHAAKCGANPALFLGLKPKLTQFLSRSSPSAHQPTQRVF